MSVSPASFRQLGKESTIYAIGRVATGLVAFFLLPIYTRVFSPSEYGIIDVISTMIALAGIVLTAGTDSALSYYFHKSDQPNHRQKTATMVALYVFTMNLLIVAIVWLFASQITALVFGDIGYASYLRISILAMPFIGLRAVSFNLLRLQHRAVVAALLLIGQVLFSVLLNIYLVVILDTGITGVFWTNVITAAGFAVVGLALTRQSLTPVFDWEHLKRIVRYGLPLIIGGLSVWSVNYLNRYFLLRFSTLDQVGLYSVGARISMAVVSLAAAFRTANLPFAFEVMSSRNSREIYSRTLTYYILGMSLISVFLSLFARSILYVVATEAYLEAYQVVPLLAYSAVAYGLYQIVSTGFLVTKRTDLAGLTTAAAVVFVVVLLLLLVPPFGIVGAALATLLANAGVVALKYVTAQRVYPIPYDLGRVFKILGLSGVVIALGLLVRPQEIWLSSLFAGGLYVIYVGLILAIPLLEPSEQEYLWGNLKQVLRRGEL